MIFAEFGTNSRRESKTSSIFVSTELEFGSMFFTRKRYVTSSPGSYFSFASTTSLSMTSSGAVAFTAKANVFKT
ncbi:Uncharacterised protein [Streptococcus pneumoniae]|nr:Uncharacterised protein [Streptococcus pneumoniae]CKH34771.1 Uncharacterised protein [Streptococcus pneumoniae]